MLYFFVSCDLNWTVHLLKLISKELDRRISIINDLLHVGEFQRRKHTPTKDSSRNRSFNADSAHSSGLTGSGAWHTLNLLANHRSEIANMWVTSVTAHVRRRKKVPLYTKGRGGGQRPVNHTRAQSTSREAGKRPLNHNRKLSCQIVWDSQRPVSRIQ